MTEKQAEEIVDLYNEMSREQRINTNACLEAIDNSTPSPFFSACVAAKKKDLDELEQVAKNIRTVVGGLRAKPIRGAKHLAALAKAMGSTERVKRFWRIVSEET